MSTCSISGNIADEPVVSLKSGHIFEKRLILKHIEINGTCPITNQPLTADDLLIVKTSATVAKPRIPTATSLPSLLNAIQTEWDSVLLESFNLRQQLETIRQELSHALYQQDAANRVIARLIKERDEARNALTQVDTNLQRAVVSTFKNVPSPAPATTTATTAMSDAEVVDKEDVGMSPRIVKAIADTWEELAGKNRKTANKARAAAVAAGVAAMSEYTVGATYASEGKITCIASNIELNPAHAAAKGTDIFAFGTESGKVFVLNTNSGSLTPLTYSAKPITSIAFAPYTPNAASVSTVLIAAAGDNSVRMWSNTASADAEWVVKHTWTQPVAPIAALAVHPSQTLIFAAGKDKQVYFLDMQLGTVRDALSLSDSITDVTVHPDGKLLAVATETEISVFNLPEKNVAATLSQKDTRTVSLSQNGYSLIATTETQVQLWDLRKMSVTATVDMPNIVAVDIDISGAHVLVSATDKLAVLGIKDLSSQHSYAVEGGVVGAVFDGVVGKIVVACEDGIKVLRKA